MARVQASVPAIPGKSHHKHWNDALEAALNQASQLGRADKTFDIEIHFSATIEVTNPGRIQSYKVTITDI
jgi:hypothetical protein